MSEEANFETDFLELNHLENQLEEGEWSGLISEGSIFGIVVSRFNSEITARLLEGAKKACAEKKIKQVVIFHVPGAVEIPLALQACAKLGIFHALIALGAVIRGETTHYDYVCEQVSAGCQQVMLEHHLPVIFGVLTTENDAQALARSGGDMGNKGAEAVEAACEMVSLMMSIDQMEEALKSEQEI